VRNRILLLAGPLVIVACSGQPTMPDLDSEAVAFLTPEPSIVAHPGVEPLKVMSRNVYLGGDISPLFGVDFGNLGEVAAVAGQIWATVLATDFQERATALADEIAAAEPHVVGLQELSRFMAQVPGAPAPFLTLDFAAILTAALADEGLSYDLVEIVENTRVQLPTLTPAGLILVDFTDRDAVLVRSDVDYDPSAVMSGNYDEPGATFALGPVILERGWIRLDIRHRGVDYHVVNTHLEVQGLAPVQVVQLAELQDMLTEVNRPTVLMGDLNSDAAAGPGAPSWTPTYGTLIDAGWVDAWLQATGPKRPGFTCCFDPTLEDADDPLTERIDFVLFRDRFEPVSGRIPGSMKAELVGDDVGDRVSGHWPSDHAGVLVGFSAPRGLFAGR
jgi:endonuclease/exonuclease/phosphatase family metal-dependent hydrolase